MKRWILQGACYALMVTTLMGGLSREAQAQPLSSEEIVSESEVSETEDGEHEASAEASSSGCGSECAGGDDGSGDSGGDEVLPPEEAGCPPQSEPHAEAQVSRPLPPRYTIESIRIEGAEDTARGLIRRLVRLRSGDTLLPDDPSINSIRWRLMATGWFDEVSLSLQRGSTRGQVVLVVRVSERNTLVVRNVHLGLSQGLAGSGDTSTDLIPYGGIGLIESNFLGTGLSLSLEGVLSKPQQALRLGASYPFLRQRGLGLSGSFHLANTREFFGRSPLVSVACPPEFIETEGECPEEIRARNAVVFYRRGGVDFGLYGELGPSSRVSLAWRGDLVHVRARPAAASERRGEGYQPIDFAIEDGFSLVSQLSASFLYETRDDPVMTRRGTLIRFQTDLASPALGSDYEFLRLQTWFQAWKPIAETQYLRFGAYAGLTFGAPPFFLKFHISDLSDFIPDRILGMNLDRRATPNFLGTSIELMRNEEFAARFDVEYGARLYSGRGGLRQLSFYVLGGVISLSDATELRFAPEGYEGFSRIPIDLTFDIGLRFDTPVGLFQVAFSNILGFVEI